MCCTCCGVSVAQVIPSFVTWFEKFVTDATRKEKRAFNFSLELHRRGINVRHLGLVIKLLLDRDTSRRIALTAAGAATTAAAGDEKKEQKQVDHASSTAQLTIQTRTQGACVCVYMYAGHLCAYSYAHETVLDTGVRFHVCVCRLRCGPIVIRTAMFIRPLLTVYPYLPVSSSHSPELSRRRGCPYGSH